MIGQTCVDGAKKVCGLREVTFPGQTVSRDFVERIGRRLRAGFDQLLIIFAHRLEHLGLGSMPFSLSTVAFTNTITRIVCLLVAPVFLVNRIETHSTRPGSLPKLEDTAIMKDCFKRISIGDGLKMSGRNATCSQYVFHA